MERDLATAPSLLAWEAGNACLGPRASAPGDVQERAQILLGLLSQVALRDPTPESLLATMRLASEHGLTFYDAAYLELATRGASSVLITQDRELLAAARAAIGPNRALDLQDAAKRLADDRFFRKEG